ncbi:MAG: lysylphosphatidylglycerol synthase transmembrane domain-containing protein [Candidatus Latescibacterota bacterium]|nr:lysylphosphatidylglycerol synthase transmembrane domain-containing protein [Candidatus Latescibacterota bacterium]
MKLLKLIIPMLGILLLGYLIGSLGSDQIVRHLDVLKWTFPQVLILAFSWHITNSIAWRFAFMPDSPTPTIKTLFKGKLAGEAVSQITPLANLGGEPLKAYLLRKTTPSSDALAAVVVNKAAQTLTGIAFSALGLSLVLLQWDLPLTIPAPIQIGLVSLMTLAILVVLIVWKKQTHLFSSILNLIGKLGISTVRVEQRMDNALSIDARIQQFYQSHKFRFTAVLFFHSLGWMLGTCETYIILRTLEPSFNFSIAFLITSLTVIINTLFVFMPSNIGVLEGGQVFLMTTLGINPAIGLSLGITKRMRKTFWLVVGWIFLSRLSREALDNELLERRPLRQKTTVSSANIPQELHYN